MEPIRSISSEISTPVTSNPNVPGIMKARIFRDLRRLLAPAGTIINLVSSPEIYTHEWASCTTKNFSENALARSGDVVRIVVTDHQDRRPVEDILWTEEAYRAVCREAGLEAVQVFEPLAKVFLGERNEDRSLGDLRHTRCKLAPELFLETRSLMVRAEQLCVQVPANDSFRVADHSARWSRVSPYTNSFMRLAVPIGVPPRQAWHIAPKPPDHWPWAIHPYLPDYRSASWQCLAELVSEVDVPHADQAQLNPSIRRSHPSVCDLRDCTRQHATQPIRLAALQPLKWICCFNSPSAPQSDPPSSPAKPECS